MLRFRVREGDGRLVRVSRDTGYEATPENIACREELRRVVGSLLRLGRDPRPQLDSLIEPKTFSAHWYGVLTALNVRQRGIYSMKDTFVTTALRVAVRIEWLEAQTSVAYSTLRKHYARWVHDDDRSELRARGEGAAIAIGP